MRSRILSFASSLSSALSGRAEAWLANAKTKTDSARISTRFIAAQTTTHIRHSGGTRKIYTERRRLAQVLARRSNGRTIREPPVYGKECPTCHAQYDTDVVVCPNDGAQLESN